MRPCLLNETGQINLKTALRSGGDLVELRDAIAQLLLSKPEINFTERDSGTDGKHSRSRTMSQIGG